MSIKDLRVAPNEFVPEKDVTKKLEDGREIVIARAGMPMPLKTAKRYGLVKPEKKSAAPVENKSIEPDSDKGGKKQ